MDRRKAPGPDDKPIETVKELDECNLDLILELLTTWCLEEDTEEEQLGARVVPI